MEIDTKRTAMCQYSDVVVGLSTTSTLCIPARVRWNARLAPMTPAPIMIASAVCGIATLLPHEIGTQASLPLRLPPSPPWRDCVGAGPSGPFPATASAEGRLIKGGPSPAPRGDGAWASARGNVLMLCGLIQPRAMWVICASSGRTSFSIASRTAALEPGIETITVPRATPAVARLIIAAAPISA